MTIRSHVVLGVLTIFLLFFLSWVVTKATAHEGTREQHEFMKPNPPGMDVPKKGTTSKYWSEWYGEHPYIKEPAPKFIFRWEINEVPRNVTVYYDVNDDGFADIVFAHPIVAENYAPSCDKRRPEQDKHWLFTTCPNARSADYFVLFEYTMCRIINQHTCIRCPIK